MTLKYKPLPLTLFLILQPCDCHPLSFLPFPDTFPTIFLLAKTQWRLLVGGRGSSNQAGK